jgi:hypothetical protein
VILPAPLDDAPRIARVHVNTWRSAYVGIVAEPTLRDMSYETSAKLQAAIRLAAAESLTRYTCCRRTKGKAWGKV